MSLPYGDPGTEGYSETDTSMQFAIDQRASAGQRQDAVLRYVRSGGAAGATVTEIKENLIPHHGTASRCLTVLHMTGKLLRLNEVRGNAKIYVAPEFRSGRPIESYVGSKARHQHEALARAWSSVYDLTQAPATSDSPMYRQGRREALIEALAVLGEMMDETITSVANLQPDVAQWTDEPGPWSGD